MAAEIMLLYPGCICVVVFIKEFEMAAEIM